MRRKAKAEISSEIEGEIRTKIEIIEALLKIDVSWETITQATQINQKLYQAMKVFYADIVSAVMPDIVDEVAKEAHLEAAYITKRWAMVVTILDHRFQLTKEQQTAIFTRLIIFHRREQVDALVNRALIVEDMGQFEDEIADLLDPDTQKSDL